jgi:hypothetical protein
MTIIHVLSILVTKQPENVLMLVKLVMMETNVPLIDALNLENVVTQNAVVMMETNVPETLVIQNKVVSTPLSMTFLKKTTNASKNGVIRELDLLSSKKDLVLTKIHVL